MNEAAVLKIIKARAGEEGTQAAVAASLAISPAYLSDVLAGRRGLSDKVLGKLGLERITTYRRVK